MVNLFAEYKRGRGGVITCWRYSVCDEAGVCLLGYGSGACGTSVCVRPFCRGFVALRCGESAFSFVAGWYKHQALDIYCGLIVKVRIARK